MDKRGQKLGHIVSPETRAKISASLKGRTYVDLGRREVGSARPRTSAERTQKWALVHHSTQQAAWRARNPGKSAMYSKRYRDADPIRAKAHRRKAHLKATYGLTEEQALRLLAQQHGLCAICKKPIALQTGKLGAHIDHDHKTKQGRGILCCGCNLGLGKFQDNPDLLETAARYLRFYG